MRVPDVVLREDVVRELESRAYRLHEEEPVPVIHEHEPPIHIPRHEEPLPIIPKDEKEELPPIIPVEPHIHIHEPLPGLPGVLPGWLVAAGYAVACFATRERDIMIP